MTKTASVLVPRTPEACWTQFTDATLLTGWVPGLRKADVIGRNADGTAVEVSFEFDRSLIYSLVYTYDRAAMEVRWEPRVGRRDAVRGSARFHPEDGGTRVVCTLDERTEGEAVALLAAFARWMSETRAT